MQYIYIKMYLINFFHDIISIHTEKSIIDATLIEPPTVMARRVSLDGLILRKTNTGSTTVSFDPVKICSARVIRPLRKYRWDNKVRHAVLQIKIRKGRLYG
jgi:hypothetical protein